MTRYVLAFFLMSFCLVMPVSVVMAQDNAIGTIAEIEGTVAMTEEGKPVVAEIGKDIYLNDTIETGAASKVLIVFIDDTEVTLGENASLAIDSYVFDADQPEINKGRFSIVRGAFLFASGLISKRAQPDVQIETAYGAIGLRGTVVWGGAIDDEYNVFVQEGEITFATERGRVTVKPGEGTRVSSRRAIPGRSSAWRQEKIDHAVRKVALANPERAKARVAEIRQKHAVRRNMHKEEMEGKRLERQELKQEKQDDYRRNRIEKQKEVRPLRSREDQGSGVRKDEMEPGQRKPDGGADNATDMERQEKRHLERRNNTQSGIR